MLCDRRKRSSPVMGRKKSVKGLPCSKRHNDEFFKVGVRGAGDFLLTFISSPQPDVSWTCFPRLPASS